MGEKSKFCLVCHCYVVESRLNEHAQKHQRERMLEYERTNNPVLLQQVTTFYEMAVIHTIQQR